MSREIEDECKKIKCDLRKTLASLKTITRLAQCALSRTLWPLFLINRIQDDRMRKKNPFPKYIRYECYLLQFFFSLKAAKPIDTVKNFFSSIF